VAQVAWTWVSHWCDMHTQIDTNNLIAKLQEMMAGAGGAGMGGMPGGEDEDDDEMPDLEDEEGESSSSAGKSSAKIEEVE